ncbi:MAG: serine hydroxymethyltransferase, partial [bacterium]|nr:serine hydroxymethyltransferase [bacterium]
KEQLQMIPSENYASKNVLRAVGSVVINKYSEGQVGKRYYQGNENIDLIESRVKELALKAFGLDESVWGVNVQPVSGSVANLAVYTSLLQPNDKIMGMYLYDGGHLSHGWKLPDGKKISFTSIMFDSVNYQVEPETGVFDYEKVREKVLAEKPQILISGGTAYPRELNHKALKEMATEVGAYYMADIAHEAGLVLAGVNNSPFEYADVVTMTTRKTLRGPIGAMIFAKKELMEKIDYGVFPRLQGGPPNHQIAGVGVALEEALTPEFKKYSKQVVVNAQTLASEFTKMGYMVTSGGTDKHLLLLDLRNKNMHGHSSAIALEKANIIMNKNTVPGETSKPYYPSGLRMGTPSLTSRGMKEEEMVKIAGWIDKVLQNQKDDTVLEQIAKEVKDFALRYKVPGIDD